MILALELHLDQLLLDLLLDAEELGVLALHGTHLGFQEELLEALVMKTIAT